MPTVVIAGAVPLAVVLGAAISDDRHNPGMDPKLTRHIAHFNKRFTNRLTRTPARYVPGFGVVRHTGRRSGRTYETPVNVFSQNDGFTFALTYGRDAQWVKNVMAAGGCELTTRGRRHRLTQPEVFQDERQQSAAPIARPMLRLVGCDEFMHLRRIA